MERKINRETLQCWLEEGKPITIVDIRPEDAYAEWHIPGSVHLDKMKALKDGDPEAMKGVELPHDIPVVTVCDRGKAGALAAEQLRRQGYDAVSLVDGLKAWSLAWNTADVLSLKGETAIIQVRRTGKGCLSYLIGSEGEAAVIDPSLPYEVYLDLANKRGWRLTAVLETHIHADHLSRAKELTETSGASLYLPVQKRVSFSFTPLQDGDTLRIGGSALRTLHTPGHTPESTSYLLDERELFSGDTLFLDGVGRPDLDTDSEGVRYKARTLYPSLQRLFALPGETVVLPAHTSKPVPFDRRPISATLAEVRRRIEKLCLSEEVFVEMILKRITPTPPNYQHIIKLNESGELPDDTTDFEAGANRCAV
jgi:glyoxylase-like metal-dependent hydrolase (beta-lactamase superfamily II)